MKSLVRGGQISLHAIRMSVQLVISLVKIFLFCVLCVIVFILLKNFDLYDIKSLMVFWFSYILDSVGLSQYGISITNRSGTKLDVVVSDIVNNLSLINLNNEFSSILSGSILFSGYLAVIVIIIALIIFKIRGSLASQERFLRGGQVVKASKLRQIILKYNLFQGAILKDSYGFSKVPFPYQSQYLHTVILGSTGTGKTTAILELLDQIRKNGDRAIVYDKMGAYTSIYYDKDKDVILNPLDNRSRSWSLFNEVRRGSDFDYLASAIIQEQGGGSDPFWNDSARKVLSIFARESHKNNPNISNKEFINNLLKANYKDIAKVLEGTEAESLINKDSQKTALSILAVISTYLSSFRYLHDDGDKFSISDWIYDDDHDGFLFISSKGDQHSSVKPLISSWIDIAVKSLLSLEQKEDRKVWIILDELASLQKMPSLMDGLSQSRQFGGAFVIALHSISQLKSIYGMDMTNTITSLCRNKLFFAVPDNEAADFCSKNLGFQEVEEMKEGISYGAHQMRDGVNLTQNRQTKRLVTPSELMLMDKLKAYVKYAGPFPVAKLDFIAKDRSAKNPRFIDKEENDILEVKKEVKAEKTKEVVSEAAEGKEEGEFERESFNILDE